jgi:hypothetical protein
MKITLFLNACFYAIFFTATVSEAGPTSKMRTQLVKALKKVDTVGSGAGVAAFEPNKSFFNRLDFLNEKFSDNFISGRKRDGLSNTVSCKTSCTLGAFRRHAEITGDNVAVPNVIYDNFLNLVTSSKRLRNPSPDQLTELWDIINLIMETQQFVENDKSLFEERNMELTRNAHATDGDEVAVKSIITNKEDTNTHTATSTGGDSDDTADSTLTSTTETTADSSPSDPYLTGDYVWPARPHVCNAVDSAGMSLCD